ncbi:uncharacterized protein KQ657_002053 [Scheffersomyces spartinae]|uniref:CBS domain-containing protein n=1 Tax=Scheffersomyces spartinae TaxID=45513 RepID=A0A9P7VDF7_9ASCO|nr:uncharacterized protein KQ657_002053 [Scheffersomyces spartinae]KAG7195672.1 hypothetical protein KQ657_002053 [Scheffersomyces spartinae]
MSQGPILFNFRDYRGATIEDLDIRPALSITPLTKVEEALELLYENDFTYLPVVHQDNKRLLGVLHVEELRKGTVQAVSGAAVHEYMIWFHQRSRARFNQEINGERMEKSGDNKSESDLTDRKRFSTKIVRPTASSGKKYHVLTPLSPLEDLASFFNDGNYFAIITNKSGNFVYGVATPDDLLRYEQSRPRL